MHKRLVDELLMLDNTVENHSVAELAEAMGVSAKTIRSDIKEIDFFLREKQLGTATLCSGTIQLTCRISLVLHEICSLTFREYFLSREERIVAETLFLIFSGNHITMQDMADFLSTSRSTVLLDISDLRENLASYQLRLVGYSSMGTELEGKEEDVRCLFVQTFRKWSFLVKIFYSTLSSWEKKGDYPFSECFRECEKLIRETEKETGTWLSDSSFEQMLFYLTFSAYRMSEGMQPADEKRDLPADSFMECLIDKLEKSRYLRLDAREESLACYLFSDLYYVKGKIQDENLMKIQMLTRKMIDNISKELHLELYRDFLLFESLTKHLERIFYAAAFDTMGLQDAVEDVLVVAREHEEIQISVRKNVGILKPHIGRELSEEEIAYIVVYFCAAINRLIRSGRVSNVIIVCNGGLGTGQLIRSQLADYFQLNIRSVMASHCLESEKMDDIDFVISTVPLYDCPKPYIVISPLLRDRDFNQIKILSEQYYHRKVNDGRFEAFSDERRDVIHYKLSQLLTPENICLDVEARDWKEAVYLAAKPLLDHGKIGREYIEDMIQYIQKHGPYVVISEGFALPHATVDHVYETSMSLARLKTPVNFGAGDMDPVELICVLCSKDSEGHMKALFDLCNILEIPGNRERVMHSKSSEEIYKILMDGEKK